MKNWFRTSISPALQEAIEVAADALVAHLKPRCENCAFARQETCRFNPPVPIRHKVDKFSWPNITADLKQQLSAEIYMAVRVIMRVQR